MRFLTLTLLLFSLVFVRSVSADSSDSGTTPDAVLTQLKQGNERFTRGKSQHPNTDMKRIQATGEQGQHPTATVITCSDSRVPVERVFDQGVGDLFVIRVAGNVCDVDEVGSIEYGVDHLGTPLMIVLGHTHCGAVTAVVTGAELHGSIPPLVDNIQPAVETAQKAHPLLHGKELVPSAVEENVWQSIDDLFKSSPATRKRVEAGTLKVVGAIYNIENGSVKWLGKHREQNRLLAYTGGGVHPVETPHEEPVDTKESTVELHEEPVDTKESVELHEEPVDTKESVDTHSETPMTTHAVRPRNAQPDADVEQSHEAYVPVAVTPVSVSLIDPTKQATLDRARHREIKAEAVTHAESTNGFGLIRFVLILLSVVGFVIVVCWKADLFGRLSVAGRLFAGFGAIVGIVLLSGVASFYTLSKVGKECDLMKVTLNLDLLVGELDAIQHEFLLAGVEDKQRGNQLLEKHRDVRDKMNLHIEMIRDRSTRLDEAETETLTLLDERSQSYAKSFSKLTAGFKKIEELKEQLDSQDEQVEEQLVRLMRKHESDLNALMASSSPTPEINRTIHLVELIGESELRAMRVFHEEAEFLMDKNLDHLTIVEQQLGQLYGYLKAVKEVLSSVDKETHAETRGLAALAKVEREVEKYQASLAQVAENELVLASDRIDCSENLHQTKQLTEALSTKAQADRYATQMQANINTWIMVVLATLAGVLLAWFTSHSITYRLHQIVVMIRDTAEGEGKGDLRRRLPMQKVNCSKIKKCGKTDCPEFGKEASCWDTVGSNASGEIHCPSILSGKLSSCHECPVMKDAIRDEVDEVSAWFNTLLGKLSQLIYDVDINASGISTSSAELATTATELASGTEEMSGQSATVATTADKMSTEMNRMASSTEQVTTNVQTVASAIEEMTASISEIAANAEQAATVAGNAADLAQSSNENIGQLGSAADEIGKVIETIQDIAEQTNLLALNATIEAARAGDAGKGFAVVATEVKELAKQTAVATEDIRGRIEGIQNTSGQAVQAIGEISQVIDQVNDFSKTIASAVEEQSVTTKEIAQNISQTSAAVQTVSDGVSESATSTNEITQNISGVDQSVKQAAESAAHTQTASSEVSRMAEQLQALVQPFKV